MSHFYTLVLVPEDTEEVQAEIDNLLADYSEHIEVDGYDKKCFCVGLVARREATEAATKKFGPFDTLRDGFWQAVTDSLPEKFQEMAKNWSNVSSEEMGEYWDERDKIAEELNWEEYISHWTSYEQEVKENHPQKDSPEEDCEDCGGTGIYTSTYNPKSKWDWYQIGGRWSGVLTGYEPDKDPENQETCWLCQGTGTRTDMTVPDGCNGCGGKGIKTAWPTRWKMYDGDIMPVGQLPEDFQIPYALVTPDGEWHEKGKMGWFGMSSNEIDENQWQDQVRYLLRQNSDCLVVVVDCHI